MLIRFSVTNCFSFRDRVEISMVAGQGNEHDEHIVAGDGVDRLRLLKTCVIYGTNASGKSNLIKAMSFAQDFIVGTYEPENGIADFRFRFDQEFRENPSSFQFEIRCDRGSYIYGFEIDSSHVRSEWLYEILERTEKPVYERVTDFNDQTTVEFVDEDDLDEESAEALENTKAEILSNRLILTEATKLRDIFSPLGDVYDWFDHVLVTIFPDTTLKGLEIPFKHDEDFNTDFRNTIRLLDVGIDDISIKEIDIDDETRISAEVRDEIKDDVLKSDEKPDRYGFVRKQDEVIPIYIGSENEIKSLRFQTGHKVKQHDHHEWLELYDESDGTRRMFHLVPAWLDLLSTDTPRVYVIDELDRRLHAILSYKLLEMFLQKSGTRPSQLVVTTHESTILDLKLLRRDEIWFVEKDVSGVSTVYSLEEFTPTYGKDIAKGYLQGRFGAIPIIPSLNNLDWLQEA